MHRCLWISEIVNIVNEIKRDGWMELCHAAQACTDVSHVQRAIPELALEDGNRLSRRLVDEQYIHPLTVNSIFNRT